jgi:hypothetical protein
MCDYILLGLLIGFGLPVSFAVLISEVIELAKWAKNKIRPPKPYVYSGGYYSPKGLLK